MSTPIPFSYFAEIAKERTQSQEYTKACIDALEHKAKDFKSLGVIGEEMKKLYREYWTYRLAYEASRPALFDASGRPAIAPLKKTPEGWRFTENKQITKAMERVGIDIFSLPEEYSNEDREQIVQYCGISYHDFCALPFIRMETKRHIFKILAEAEASHQSFFQPKSYQDTIVLNEKFVYRTNKLVLALGPFELVDFETNEQIRQLLGGDVVPIP